MLSGVLLDGGGGAGVSRGGGGRRDGGGGRGGGMAPFEGTAGGRGGADGILVLVMLWWWSKCVTADLVVFKKFRLAMPIDLIYLKEKGQRRKQNQENDGHRRSNLCNDAIAAIHTDYKHKQQTKPDYTNESVVRKRET